ncbi:hypothetical protein GGI07_004164 [Coemansia sp. Benny D115]|nr:hypothetical protein GGI07_004164 [Coemansia sp. Benny D115]
MNTSRDTMFSSFERPDTGTLPDNSAAPVTPVMDSTMESMPDTVSKAPAALSQKNIMNERQRGKYVGIFSGTYGLASAVAPVIGGVIVQNTKWQVVFWINLPFCVVALVMIVMLLRIPRPKGSAKEKLKKVDFIGSLLCLAGVVILLLGLSWGGRDYAWKSTQVICTLVFGVFILILFVLYEWKVPQEPIVPVHMFNVRNVILTSAGNVLFGFAINGAIMFIPQWALIVKRASEVTSGAYLIPCCVGMVLTSVISGVLVSKTGRCREIIVVGAAFLTVGNSLLIVLGTDGGLGKIIGFLLICGLGIGTCMQTINLIGQASVEGQYMASSTTMFMFFRSLGMVLAVSVLSNVIQNVLHSEIAKIISEFPLYAKFIGEVLRDQSLLYKPDDVPGALQTAFVDSYAKSLKSGHHVISINSGMSPKLNRRFIDWPYSFEQIYFPFEQYVKSVLVDVNLDDLASGFTLNMLSSPPLSHASFVNARYTRFVVGTSAGSIMPQHTDEVSLERLARDVPKITGQLKRLFPRINKIVFTEGHYSYTWSDVFNRKFSDFYCGLLKDIPKVGLQSRYFIKLLTIDPQEFTNITALDYQIDGSLDAIIRVMQLNAQTLQELKVVSIGVEPVDAYRFITDPDGNPVVYPNVQKLVFRVKDSNSTHLPHTEYSKYAPFPNLRDLDIDNGVPFTGDTVFRGNSDKLLSLKMAMEQHFMHVMECHRKKAKEAFSKLQYVTITNYSNINDRLLSGEECIRNNVERSVYCTVFVAIVLDHALKIHYNASEPEFNGLFDLVKAAPELEAYKKQMDAHPVRPNSDKVYYGLLLSTLGDILLMLPASNETFMFGLLSFLAAHVFYAMAFKRQDKGKGDSRVRWTSVPFGAFASAMLWMLIPGVKREGGVVTVGVVVYVVAISVMAYRSTLTGKGLLVLGSVLFCISDSVLAWDRFLGHLAWGEMAVMSTYYAAQLCIALAHSS